MPALPASPVGTRRGGDGAGVVRVALVHHVHVREQHIRRGAGRLALNPAAGRVPAIAERLPDESETIASIRSNVVSAAVIVTFAAVTVAALFWNNTDPAATATVMFGDAWAVTSQPVTVLSVVAG